MTSSEADMTIQPRRWEVPLFSKVESVEEPPPVLTAEEIEAIERTAHAEGYARGHAEGFEHGHREAVQLVREQAERFRDIVDFLARPLAELDHEVERTLVALTIEVARRLVDDQLQLDPTLTAQVVRDAVASLAQPPREARVHLNPDDAAILAEHLTAPPDVSSWRIVPDRELRRGDCRVLTDNAQIDALLDTRQAGVARALLEEGE